MFFFFFFCPGGVLCTQSASEKLGSGIQSGSPVGSHRSGEFGLWALGFYFIGCTGGGHFEEQSIPVEDLASSGPRAREVLG